MEHGTAPGDTTGPGHGNLLVLLAACRGLGACHQSLLSLHACFIALFTVLLCGFFADYAHKAQRRNAKP